MRKYTIYMTNNEEYEVKADYFVEGENGVSFFRKLEDTRDTSIKVSFVPYTALIYIEEDNNE